MSIRLLIAEDHILVRQALRSLLSSHDDIEIEREATTGTEVLACLADMAPTGLPDLLLLDIDLPGLSGIEVMKAVRRTYGRLPTLALSAYLDAGFLQQMLTAGANGFVHKGREMNELVAGIRSVAAGGRYLCDSSAALLKESEAATRRAPGTPKLGRREREVLRLVARGWRSQDIAAELEIALGTVDVHRRNIMRKLDLHSVADLTRYAMRIGLVGPE